MKKTKTTKQKEPTCRTCQHLKNKGLFVECGLKVKNNKADKNRVNGKCQLYEKGD